MLQALSIRDMALIETAELDFRPGLNVLTGETGAGKSILLDCLGFVLGWRGRGGEVRPGAAAGEVVALFAVGPGPSRHGASSPRPACRRPATGARSSSSAAPPPPTAAGRPGSTTAASPPRPSAPSPTPSSSSTASRTTAA